LDGNNLDRVRQILEQSKLLAKKYKSLTGKPLGITGEIAEFAAADKLGLTLSPARQEGYDAENTENEKKNTYQIKVRQLKEKKKSGRLGKIRLDTEWDYILMVLLDEDFEVISIRKASREDVRVSLENPGSISRNERGTLSISQFIKISELVWGEK
jgi:Family of unknown function (DUF6998)